jgi:hypothetical protein
MYKMACDAMNAKQIIEPTFYADTTNCNKYWD